MQIAIGAFHESSRTVVGTHAHRMTRIIGPPVRQFASTDRPDLLRFQVYYFSFYCLIWPISELGNENDNMLAIQLVAIRLQKRLLDDVWPGDMEITFQVQRIWYGHH